MLGPFAVLYQVSLGTSQQNPRVQPERNSHSYIHSGSGEVGLHKDCRSLRLDTRTCRRSVSYDVHPIGKVRPGMEVEIEMVVNATTYQTAEPPRARLLLEQSEKPEVKRAPAWGGASNWN